MFALISNGLLRDQPQATANLENNARRGRAYWRLPREYRPHRRSVGHSWQKSHSPLRIEDPTPVTDFVRSIRYCRVGKVLR